MKRPTPIWRGTKDVKTLYFRYRANGVERTISTKIQGRKEHYGKNGKFDLRGNIPQSVKDCYRKANDWLERFFNEFSVMRTSLDDGGVTDLDEIREREEVMLANCSVFDDFVGVSEPVIVNHTIESQLCLMDDRKGLVSASSLALYKSNIDFIARRLKAMGKTMVSDLNKRTVEEYISNRSLDGVGQAKVKSELNVIRQFAKILNAHGILSDEYLSSVLSVKPSSKADVSSEKIALTDEEVEALWKYCPSKRKLKVARDIFLICVSTSQRISDISGLDCSIGSNSAMVTEQGGVKMLILTQRKTSAKVVVPLLDERVYELLDEYGFTLPHITLTNYNNYVREVCRGCGGTFLEQVMVTTRKANKTNVDIRHRWELVSSHTARRTGITNLLMRGVDSISVMGISGHTSTSMVERYNKRTSMQNALLVASKLMKK